MKILRKQAYGPIFPVLIKKRVCVGMHKKRIKEKCHWVSKEVMAIYCFLQLKKVVVGRSNKR